MLESLFETGRVVDLILLFVAVEAAILIVWFARSGRRASIAPLIANLASGAALMLAVRAAIVSDPWPVIAACLLASFFAHATELALRLRRQD